MPTDASPMASAASKKYRNLDTLLVFHRIFSTPSCITAIFSQGSLSFPYGLTSPLNNFSKLFLCPFSVISANCCKRLPPFSRKSLFKQSERYHSSRLRLRQCLASRCLLFWVCLTGLLFNNGITWFIGIFISQTVILPSINFHIPLLWVQACPFLFKL